MALFWDNNYIVIGWLFIVGLCSCVGDGLDYVDIRKENAIDICIMLY